MSLVDRYPGDLCRICFPSAEQVFRNRCGSNSPESSDAETEQPRKLPNSLLGNLKYADCGAMIGTAESGDDFMHNRIAPAARQFH